MGTYGQGDDSVTFHYGDQTFVYTSGDGNDVYTPYVFGSHLETIILQDGTFADTYLSRHGDDLSILDTRTGQAILFQNWGEGAAYQVEIEFADGSSLDNDDVAYWTSYGDYSYTGGKGPNTIMGSFRDQRLYGGEGDDVIDGGDGNDTLSVSHDSPGDVKALDGDTGINTADFTRFGSAISIDLAANDVVALTSDAATLDASHEREVATLANIQNLIGTAFDDVLRGDGDANLLVGLAGNDTLEGLSGNDTLDGGAGDDLLVAGSGSNTVIFGLGYGSDTLVVERGGSSSGTNVVDLGPGLSASDLSFTRSGSDLVVSVIGTGDRLTITGQLAPGSRSGVDRFVLADGSSISAFAARSLALRAEGGTTLFYQPGDGDVTVSDLGTAHWSTLDLSSFRSDQVTLQATADGRGLSIALAGGGSITILDGLDLGSGLSSLTFADGVLALDAVLPMVTTTDQVSLAGIDGHAAATANDGDAVLKAGSGDDTLTGANGNDTFVYGRADGNLTIKDHASWWYGNNINTLQLVDLDAEDVVLSRDRTGDLIVTVAATGRTVTVADYFSSTARDGVAAIAFADGTAWNRGQITANAPYRPTANFLPDWGSTTDLTRAPSGLFVGDYGDSRNDETVLWGSAGGSDTVQVHDFNAAARSTLALTDLDQADVTLSRVNQDLQVVDKATGAVLTVAGQFSNNGSGVAAIAFADGTIWDRNQIANQAAFDQRAGSNDVALNAPEGDTRLTAGAGNDMFNGGNGDDTFVYSDQCENLMINDLQQPGWGTNTNTLRLTDLNPGDLTFSQKDNDLLIAISGSGKTIDVVGEFSANTIDGVDRVQFSNGTMWTRSDIIQKAQH